MLLQLQLNLKLNAKQIIEELLKNVNFFVHASRYNK